jgi:large subunit ribosomal protein L5
MAKKESVDYKAKWKHPMQKPFIDKVILNIGVGQGGEELVKATKVLEDLSQSNPVIIKAKKNVKEWNVRRGQSIATKVTLRGQKAIDLIKRTLDPFDNRILKKAFDNKGSVSWGIDEHIKVPGVKYDPEVGIFGFNLSVKIARPGYRIKDRKKDRRKVGKNHYLTKDEAIYFMQTVIGAEVVEKMEERYY